MIDFDFNAENYWAMLSSLGVKERVKIMRTAMHRSANEMKKRAGDLLLSRLSHVRDASAMKKTIWTQVYTKTAGFKVAVAGNKHCYPARQRDLPLGRWLETGTESRKTRKGGFTRGTLPAIGFLRQTEEEMMPAINDHLIDNFKKQVQKTAKKYGCI